ncbi:hypothetical protein [Paenibacillus hubeiensis]|uniref:hypothetical protein n=1 Tax=Paenibacillus hubeiensis TaxID=3077330 RepID=UPI0031BA94A4
MVKFDNPFKGVSIDSIEDLKRLKGIDLIDVGLATTAIPKLRDMLDIPDPYENLPDRK